VVARWQFGEIGVTLSMLKTRLARGSLAPLHRGVYAVGHRQLRPEAHSLAAVLAAGPGAVASHRDAAWLHGLRPGNHRRSDVTTTRRVRSTDRIRVHRTTALSPDDVTTVDGIPVTTVARTLVDLACVVPVDHLEKVILEADRRRLLDVRSVDAALARTLQRTAGGRATLIAALDQHASYALQLDAGTMERLLLAIVRSNALPPPLIRHMLDGREIDACWPQARVAVELDGWEFHRHRRAFQSDREKSNTLTVAGWTVLRFTHHDLAHRPAYVAEQLARVL
jgi:very-short-patch-repair endonuclease